MGTRGRRSIASLSVVPTSGAVLLVERPKPPAELTHEQAAEWRTLTSSQPADYFTPEAQVLLIQVCRHRVTTKRLDELIASCEAVSEGFDPDQYGKLLKMRATESQVITTLLTKLRLTPQSRYDRQKKRAPLTKKPWD